jgi:hypothetical protein
MAKSGSIAESQLTDNLAFTLVLAKETRHKRDAALVQRNYQAALKEVNHNLDQAIKEAENNPELGILIALQCTRFVMEAMPDAKQDVGRATMINQCETLETLLAAVRKPDEYLANRRKKYGPNLDPRHYPASVDAFSSTVKSQRQKLHAEGQGFNSQPEKNFCTKRSTLLAAVERGYNRLREHALGIRPTDRKKSPQ